MTQIIIMQCIAVMFNTYIANTENKFRLYFATFLFNLTNLIMYALNGDKTTALIYIIICIRSFVYIYKDRFKTIIIPIIAILLQLIVGFTTIENIWQLIPICVPCIVCYYMWFSQTTQQLRVWNMICNGLWGLYNFKTGLYIVMANRIITVIVNGIAYIRGRKNKS